MFNINQVNLKEILYCYKKIQLLDKIQNKNLLNKKEILRNHKHNIIKMINLLMLHKHLKGSRLLE